MYYVERDSQGYIRRAERLADNLEKRDLRLKEARRVLGFDWDYEVPVEGEGVFWLAGLSEAELRRLTKEEGMKDLNWNDIPGGRTPHREMMLKLVWATLTPEEQARARLVVCSDERTGRRFGLAAKRRGKAIKIGGGGRNRGSRLSPYQVWLVWAEDGCTKE